MERLSKDDFHHIFEQKNTSDPNSLQSWFSSWFAMPPTLESGIAMEALAKKKRV